MCVCVCAPARTIPSAPSLTWERERERSASSWSLSTAYHLCLCWHCAVLQKMTFYLLLAPGRLTPFPGPLPNLFPLTHPWCRSHLCAIHKSLPLFSFSPLPTFCPHCLQMVFWTSNRFSGASTHTHTHTLSFSKTYILRTTIGGRRKVRSDGKDLFFLSFFDFSWRGNAHTNLMRVCHTLDV